MGIHQEHQRIRSFFASRLVLICLFLLLVGMGVISFRSLLAGEEIERQRREVEEELTDLEVRKQKLTSELEDLRSGKGIEREAREKLNFRKPGEEVVIILDSKDSLQNNSEEQEAGFLWKLLRWLGIK